MRFNSINSKRKIAFVGILTTLFCAFLYPLNAQDYLFLSSEQFLNTNIYNLNAEINQNVFKGLFSLSQRYKGVSEQNLTFRDEDNISLSYLKPISKSLALNFKNNFYYADDSKSIGINKIHNLLSNFGAQIKKDNFSIESGIGYKDIYQIGKKSNGGGIYLIGDLKDYSLEDIYLGGNLNAEKYWLSDKRDLSDINLSFKSYSDVNSDDNFAIGVNYKRQYKDFYSPISSSQIFLETRFENRYSLSSVLNYKISDKIKLSADATIENISLERAFSSADSLIILTKTLRNLSAQQTQISVKANFNFKTIAANIGISADAKNEYNTAKSKFYINDNDLKSFNNQEAQRDIKNALNRAFANTSIAISNKDTLGLSLSAQVLKYDTPSALNDDDRDEAGYLGNLFFKRRFSENLTAKLSLDFTARHLIYLKATRSSQNKWDRFIRLSEKIEINLDNFYYSPEFEVFANYSSFDYEKVLPNLQSFSFRQVAYRDTIKYQLNSQYSLEISNNLRYFQRASFYWNNFSENPESYNFETFNKILLSKNFLLNCYYSIGTRFYLFYKKSAHSAIASIINYDENRYSISPEAKLEYAFDNSSLIGIYSWYEFQFLNKNKRREIPNFLIQLNYRL